MAQYRLKYFGVSRGPGPLVSADELDTEGLHSRTALYTAQVQLPAKLLSLYEKHHGCSERVRLRGVARAID